MNARRTQIRRPFFIGTGTLIALLLAALIGVQRYRNQTRPPANPPKITNVKNSKSVPLEQTIAIKMLGEREQLGLDQNQTAALEKIVAEWKTQSKPVQEDLERLSGEFNRYMNGLDPEKPPSAEALQKRTAPVSEATREYIRLRDDFDRRALDALTPEQRKKWNNSQKTRN
jgi:tetrahydromethanopterin S-methyltransferase subunit B